MRRGGFTQTTTKNTVMFQDDIRMKGYSNGNISSKKWNLKPIVWVLASKKTHNWTWCSCFCPQVSNNKWKRDQHIQHETSTFVFTASTTLVLNSIVNKPQLSVSKDTKPPPSKLRGVDDLNPPWVSPPLNSHEFQASSMDFWKLGLQTYSTFQHNKQICKKSSTFFSLTHRVFLFFLGRC